MTRALLMPLAQSSTLKPCGTLILPIGISLAAFGAGGWAIGDSVELSMSFGCPCFHVGGAVDCWAATKPDARRRAETTVSASANRNGLCLMTGPPQGHDGFGSIGARRYRSAPALSNPAQPRADSCLTSRAHSTSI